MAVAVTAVGLLLMVPLTLVVLSFGAVYAFPNSWLLAEASMLIASIGLYGAGRRAGEGVVEDLIPARMRDQIDHLGTKGTLGLAALRWIPVAHFGLLSMALGALRVPLSRYVLSTLIGQTRRSCCGSCSATACGR